MNFRNYGLFAVFIILTVVLVIAGEQDPTTFGNSTHITARLGGQNGTLNITGNAYISGGLNSTGIVFIAGSQACTAGNGLCTGGSGSGNISGAGTANTIPLWFNASYINNSALTQTGATNITAPNMTILGSIDLRNAPAICPGDNTFMTRFQGINSTCTVINQSAFGFYRTTTCSAGTVLQNVTLNTSGVYGACVTDSGGSGGGQGWNQSGTIVYTNNTVLINGSATPTLRFNDTTNNKQFEINLGSSGNIMNIKTPSGANVVQVIDSSGSLQTQNLVSNPSYNGAIAIDITLVTGMTTPALRIRNSSNVVMFQINSNDQYVNLTMMSPNGTSGTCFMNNTKGWQCV